MSGDLAVNDLAAEPWAVPGLRRVTYASQVDGLQDEYYRRPPGRGTDWVVYLHGHGSKGDQLFTRPDIRARWWPEVERRELGVLSPTLRGNAWMGPAAAADLHALLVEARRHFGARRFVFVGGSMGGSSCLIYGVLHPGDAAAVVALCPATDLSSYHAGLRSEDTGIRREIAEAIEAAYGGDPSRAPELYERHSALANHSQLTMPLFLGAASGDALIPVEQCRLLAAAKTGTPAFRYRELQGGDHDSPLSLLPEALSWVCARL
jgi:pimeloyl-ACP methyl ester carboxylesterase